MVCEWLQTYYSWLRKVSMSALERETGEARVRDRGTYISEKTVLYRSLFLQPSQPLPRTFNFREAGIGVLTLGQLTG